MIRAAKWWHITTKPRSKEFAHMSEMTWHDAIVEVLREANEPMHYTEIADAIAERGLKKDLGPVPARSVSATIAAMLNDDVIRVKRGYYALPVAEHALPILQDGVETEAEAPDVGFINAFGMYWERDQVVWNNKSGRMLGQQASGSSPVNFWNQRGVYLLYDGHEVVYVGRTTEQALGTRLKQHVSDRLKGRWDRFSWFGIFPPNDAGDVNTTAPSKYGTDMLIATMEALLIEGLEPPQNRKRGDDFRAVEFLQVEDPELRKHQVLQLFDELKNKL